jgi:hypothetical protein
MRAPPETARGPRASSPAAKERLIAQAAVLGASVGIASHAAALEPFDVAGRSVLTEVTEATSVIYNADNRDSVPLDVPSAANDHAGFVYNRLNLHATSEPFRLSVRLDGAWFFTSPTPRELASDLVRGEPDPALRADLYQTKATEAGIELSNRYINWLYPAKYTLTYAARDFELSLGDNSAQLGRGLVLSVRKVDELSSDTTIRGARVSARFGKPGARVKLVLLGGSMNPLRIDEASGRYLGVHSSVTPGFVQLTEAGMPRAIATDFTPEASDCAGFGTCSYAPDRVVAGGAEIDLRPLTLGTQASLLVRTEPLGRDTVRSAGRILTASQSAELLRIGDAGTAYVEAAVQKLSEQDVRQRRPARDGDPDGEGQADQHGPLRLVGRRGVRPARLGVLRREPQRRGDRGHRPLSQLRHGRLAQLHVRHLRRRQLR